MEIVLEIKVTEYLRNSSMTSKTPNELNWFLYSAKKDEALILFINEEDTESLYRDKKTLRVLQELTDKQKADKDVMYVVIVTAITTTVALLCATALLAWVHYVSMWYYKRQQQRRFYAKLSTCLPEIEVSNTENDFNQKEWVICLEDFSCTEKLRQTSDWKHIFHSKWIEAYYIKGKCLSFLDWELERNSF